MKKIVVLVLLLCYPNLVFAQNFIDPQQQAAVSPMQKGKIAPFEGLLLSPAAVAEIIADKSTAAEKCQIEIDAKVKECKAKSDFVLKETIAKSETDISVLKSSIVEKEKEIKRLDESLKSEISNRPNTTFLTTTSFFVGVTVTLLGFFGVSQIVK